MCVAGADLNHFKSNVRSANGQFKLPVFQRSHDVEHATAPTDTVACPVRGQGMPVDYCKSCRSFRGLEQDGTTTKVGCIARELHTERALSGGRELEARDVIRVPLVCVTKDTKLRSVLPYLGLQHPWDVIVVLDWSARPLGVVTRSDLEPLLAMRGGEDMPLSRVLQTDVACVSPCMSLDDVARLRPQAKFRGALVVTTEDGVFLGIVTEADLTYAALAKSG
jgi:CBS domain-containing protein